MDKAIFWNEYTDQPTGDILYQTEAILDGDTITLSVQLCDKLIKFGKMCLQYNFDLKFGVKESEIKFQYDQKYMAFTLPRKDQKLWKEVLRLHLNQKGFHQAFKPIKKIGKGNFASVYLVQKIENKQKYAVKAFSKESAYSEQNGKECLIKEIQIMRHLHHHNLMRLIQVFQSDNSLYIIFQLLEGGQLYDKIKEKHVFTPREVRQVILCLLKGLKEMHDKGIMHRDLKPQNILIREKGGLECVIADFGLAEFVNSEEYLFVRCGTPGYVAPEVINIKDMKKRYSSICDIFSLGLIFHILLFGFSLFRKKTYNQVLAENRACKYDFSDDFYEMIPPEALDLLKKMLRVSPDQRITAEQALAHPYFNISLQEQEQLRVLKPKISMASTNQGDSPTMKPIQKIRLEKDSCLEFKLGKQNIMNGNINTIADTGKTKVSMFGQAMTPGRVSKISKFSRAQ